MNISINHVPSILNEITYVGAYGFSSTRCFEPSFFKKMARPPVKLLNVIRDENETGKKVFHVRLVRYLNMQWQP